MIAEKITVTTTPTTIHSLICQARGEALGNDNIKSVMFRTSGSAAVLMEEKNTNTAVTMLDPANDQPFIAYEDFNLTNIKLSVASATAEVEVIASQTGSIGIR